MQPYEELEQKLATWSGMPYVVACSSGTAALHLALETLPFPNRNGQLAGALGSMVVVPEFTMIACARAVVLADLRPVFVDCQDDLLLKTSRMEPLHTDGIMAVHIYGRVCNMEAVHEWARKQSPYAFVIEDLAEAHGVQPHPYTDAACWSFYRNKIVAGEEGGAVAFRNPLWAEKARRLRSLGFGPEHNFIHEARGHNYRLSNLHAAPILKSLEELPKNLRLRREVEKEYDALITELWKMPPRSVVWVYDLRIPGMTEEVQDEVIRRLREKGIQARHGFKPMSEQPEFYWYPASLNAHRLSREVIYLPVTPNICVGQIKENVTALLDAVKQASKNGPKLLPV